MSDNAGLEVVGMLMDITGDLESLGERFVVVRNTLCCSCILLQIKECSFDPNPRRLQPQFREEVSLFFQDRKGGSELFSAVTLHSGTVIVSFFPGTITFIRWLFEYLATNPDILCFMSRMVK